MSVKHKGQFAAAEFLFKNPNWGYSAEFKEFCNDHVNDEITHQFIDQALGTTEWVPNGIWDRIEKETDTTLLKFLEMRYREQVIKPEMKHNLDQDHQYFQVIFSYNKMNQQFFNYSALKIPKEMTEDEFKDWLKTEGTNASEAVGASPVESPCKASCCCYGWGCDDANCACNEGAMSCDTKVEEVIDGENRDWKHSDHWFFKANGKFFWN
jgi:hypothetical protein